LLQISAAKERFITGRPGLPHIIFVAARIRDRHLLYFPQTGSATTNIWQKLIITQHQILPG